ncbi:transcription factor RSL2-like isoform X2 [Phragmites australis]|uniref:transcription factor RSL2-like isoform X2 n=1 Tax=Phragmites australis TaxID=29695 RepID=UPI002D78D41F|nr:transcription factor RSL2-like isoform X2 [Phragmites australis]
MEPGGVIAEAGWSSLDLPSQAEESEIMQQLLGTFPSNGEEDHQELPWSIQSSSACYFLCNASSSTYSSTSSNSSGGLLVPSEYGAYYLSDSNEALGINSSAAPLYLNMVQEQGEGAAQFMDTILNPPYGSGDLSCEDLGDSSMNLLASIGTSDKRKHLEQGQLDGQARGRKCARKSDSKRAKKNMKREGEDGSGAAMDGQSLSCCASENDSNSSQGPPVTSNLNGKAQADGRSATESQSLYARKRRERINERLRILQNLVPNGTKVDLSTMLEEAVQYVKFLQLQIKLLSSDEMWIYAPIAYNGMDIGIDLNLSQH